VVDHWVDGDVGVAAMYRFTETAPGQLQEAILDLKNQGVKAIILDLRSNGGGLLDSAREIANFFLPKYQVIVRVVDRQGNEETYQTTQVPIWEGPLAVLVNSGSASASEVVSGALQDYQRASLLGVLSFGKGTVQVPYQLSDGSRVWVTQYHYLTPNGRDINQKGLTPDVIIEQPENAKTDQQLAKAVQYVTDYLLER
jgi:carboxyl-terminal processing protease